MRIAFILLFITLNACDGFYWAESNSPSGNSKELKVLVYKSPLTYEKKNNWHAQTNEPIIFGLDYDLLQSFAAEIGYKIKFIPYTEMSVMEKDFAAGVGQIMAGRILSSSKYTFQYLRGPVYEETQFNLYCHNERPDFKTIAIQEKNKIPKLEMRLQKMNAQIQWIVNSNTAQLMSMVQEKNFDCAVLDQGEAAYYGRRFSDVEKFVTLTDKVSLHWVLQPELKDLQRWMRSWFQKSSRNNAILKTQTHYRYSDVSTKDTDLSRIKKDMRSKLPLYENIFKQTARELHLDWKLIAAVAYQESHWNPDAVSPTGVRGIMQITEETARFLGLVDRLDPILSIVGGGYYIRYLWDLHKGRHLSAFDKLSLVLASYNMGYGHVKDAQKIVVSKGGNPKSWYDFKRVLKYLSDPNYESKLDYGLARGYEAEQFVENVLIYYSLLEEPI